MPGKDRLAQYRSKRDPATTPEPRGHRRARRGDPVFVVQRHDASTLHFDFRLEIDGVLVSWSVPKGPSLDPRDRRLAIRTEDHPLDYADFEGTIPPGEYGGGTVIVWDTGTFDVLTEEPAGRALADGHLKVVLHGDKLTGRFSLIRKRSGDHEEWLVIKKDDEGADRRRKPAKTQPESVLSGRTNRELG
ncbi:DNA polymerase ligase N-terminal domain-containing protein [Amycolatopsis sp. FDAARGOS 1241]|uniref:DNA polymerase ligase N-terminal domain-containing protein n=1 Tax=Amycolatopsis sp. FDAARGOS 1241 TaxID=2778070 RepID=UPI0019508903|nr:DNA polymerase ligase N-terminal domain-containing protein [Amycolatopsis sp. FDAARGOS 1241]QRP48841.1 DNA ligase [Amycolatopsis sp. FDAARGOS 1241]